MSIAKITDIIAETAVACTLLCGDGSAIDNETEDDEVPHDYAPFIDEAEGRESHDSVLITRLRNDKKRLKDEIQALEYELDEVKSYEPPEPQTQSQASETGEKEASAGVSFEATYYTAFCDTGCTGVTATGKDVSNTTQVDGKRVIAVDPGVIPLGSDVRVTTPNETFTATAQDTGGNINGNRIDILVGTSGEAKRLGRHDVTVEVLN